MRDRNLIVLVGVIGVVALFSFGVLAGWAAFHNDNNPNAVGAISTVPGSQQPPDFVPPQAQTPQERQAQTTAPDTKIELQLLTVLPKLLGRQMGGAATNCKKTDAGYDCKVYNTYAKIKARTYHAKQVNGEWQFTIAK